MQSVLVKPTTAEVRTGPRLDFVQPQERVALAYFLFLTALSLTRPVLIWQRGILLALPLVLCALWFWETSASRTWSRIARQWSSLALILIGYWALEWFSAPPITRWQDQWLRIDRLLLESAGLRELLDSTFFVPYVLETLYFLLYAMPSLALGALYLCKARERSGKFLLILLLGTFSAYALLPLFPVESPRVAFPNADLPRFNGLPRVVNTWLLDRLDISTSVFPSGHVAVAFSSAFGLLSVLRERRRIWSAAFLVAFLIYVATVFGRYHYAVDGLASITISCVAWKVAERWSSIEP